MARLSVILCNYNHAGLVGRAIDAIVSQSRRPDQLVIIDDGSTDDSVAVIRRHSEGSPFVVFEALAQNTKAIGALNRATELADGDYEYFASSDDYILPGFFAQAMALADTYPQAGIVFGKMVTIDAGGRELNVHGVDAWEVAGYYPPDRVRHDLIEAHDIAYSLCSATVYKRSAILEMGGFRSELMSWGDTFLVRAIALKWGACYFPERVVVWTRSETSYSGSMQRNPLKVIDVFGRVLWLMKSDAYQGVFSPADIRNMEAKFREYRARVAIQYSAHLRKDLEVSGQGLLNVLPGKPVSLRLLRGVAVGLIAWMIRAVGWLARRSIHCYEPDLSCYAKTLGR